MPPEPAAVPDGGSPVDEALREAADHVVAGSAGRLGAHQRQAGERGPLKSLPGQGTTFVIALPIEPVPTETALPA